MNLGNSKINNLIVHKTEKQYTATDDYFSEQNINNPLSHIVNQIQAKTTVLDVGCSNGYLGKWLKTNKGCNMYGIDINERAIALIRKESTYKDTFIIDLDYPDKNGEDFARFDQLGECFDFVVCADLLEHLKDPTSALIFLSSKLKMGGQILVSVPNISNIDIVLNLIEGRFNYSEFGLLDNTHLRFFTKSSIVEWVYSINKVMEDYKFDFKFIGSTRYISDFTNIVENQYPLAYELLCKNIENFDILQHLFVLTKVNKYANTYSLNKSISEIESDYAIKNINNILAGKENQLKNLQIQTESLKEKNNEILIQLEQKEDKLKVLNSKLEYLKNSLYEKESAIKLANEKLHKKDIEINALNEQLIHIYNSNGWRFLLKYYKLRDYMLPQNSSRRKLLKVVFNIGKYYKKFILYIKKYGLKGFFIKVRQKVSKSENESINLYVPKVNFASENEILVNKENIKISVIIPTKNAGENFEYLLICLTNQKGFEDVEIIVVDSGSIDGTVQLANEYGAKVIRIKPEDFSHSYARNLGAEKASGKYLLFVTQDILPPSEKWIYELFSAIKNNPVSAVSCVEFPRKDADLFYRVSTWSHYNFLGVNNTDKIMEKPVNESYVFLRRNCQLSDITCLIDKDTFMNYKYRFEYAEDLDLGLRLINDGYKLALLSSVKVIHSHNRDAYYFLKRAFVDNIYLNKIFNDFIIPKIDDKDMISDIVFTYNFIIKIANIKFEAIVNRSPNDIENSLFIMFEEVKNRNYPVLIDINSDIYGDTLMKEFINKIYCRYDYNAYKNFKYHGALLNSVKSHIHTIFEYMEISYAIIDKSLVDQLKSSIYKAFAVQCGAHLAFASINDDKNDTMKDIYNCLKVGV